MQVTMLYPSFIFNSRRKYDKSRRGDASFAGSFASKASASLHLKPGEHSFDAIPQQKPVETA